MKMYGEVEAKLHRFLSSGLITEYEQSALGSPVRTG